MSRLSQHGGFNEEAIEKAKAQMAEGLDFAEQQEPLARNGAGYPSTAGFIEQHFNFEEGALDFARCQRPDGSYYGTSGQCKKGAPAGPKEKDAPSGKAKGGSKGSSKADISAKAKEVRAMDKEAKAANKAADAAEKKWRKGGMKDKELQKEVRRLDKEAKAKDKEADRSDRELARMRKSAESAKGREKNVKLNQALAQDGPKATPKQRAQAVRYLKGEQRRLESREDDGTLTKAGQARLKLVKASLREYEIAGKQRMSRQVGR